MRVTHFDVIFFLVACAAAMALLHIAVTYRERGSLTLATALIGLGKAVMLVLKVFPARFST